MITQTSTLAKPESIARDLYKDVEVQMDDPLFGFCGNIAVDSQYNSSLFDANPVEYIKNILPELLAIEVTAYRELTTKNPSKKRENILRWIIEFIGSMRTLLHPFLESDSDHDLSRSLYKR